MVENELKQRFKALVGESAPTVPPPAGELPRDASQEVSGSGNIAVLGNRNRITVQASNPETYAAVSTVQLVQEQHALLSDHATLVRQHENALRLKLAATMGPPLIGLLTLKHFPSDLMMATWLLFMGAGVVGWFWGTQREAQLVRAKRAVALKLDAVQAHLLHRNNWHPLGAREAR